MTPSPAPALSLIIPAHLDLGVVLRAAAAAKMGTPWSAETKAAVAARRAVCRQAEWAAAARLLDVLFEKEIADFIKGSPFGRSRVELLAWFDIPAESFAGVMYRVSSRFPVGSEMTKRGTLYGWGAIGRWQRQRKRRDLQIAKGYDSVKSQPKRRGKYKKMKGKKIPTGANQRACFKVLESYPPGQELTAQQIADAADLGREATNTALRALRDRGEIKWRRDETAAGRPFFYITGPRLKVSTQD